MLGSSLFVFAACHASSDGGRSSDGEPDASLSPMPGADGGRGSDAAMASETSDVDAATAPPAPIGPTGTWTLVFADEFDGTSLDGSKWSSGWWTDSPTATSAPTNSYELQSYGPEGIVFPGDGAVHLRLRAVPKNAYGKTYESGMIQSSNRFTFDPTASPTVIEARIRVAGPNAKAGGYWPAFWLLPNANAHGGSGGWPPEIDVFELFGSSNAPRTTFHTTGEDINYQQDVTPGSLDLSLAFHVYTFEMSSSAFTLYFDGAKSWTYTDTDTIANMLAKPPLYVLFNFAFGSDGDTATAAIPNDMVIDYFRTWRRGLSRAVSSKSGVR